MKNFELKQQDFQIERENITLSSHCDSAQDVLAEEILENMNSTPLGLVLKQIATLPEIRQKKVLDVRQRICTGQYDEQVYLDNVLEKVLGEL